MSANFSNATVAVTANGVTQTVEILSDDANGYGGNAIVWDLPYACRRKADSRSCTR